jgi:hypothetical protein
MSEPTPPLLPGEPSPANKPNKPLEPTTDSTAVPVVTPVNSLGCTVEEQQPIRSVFEAAEAVLRQPRRVLFQVGEAGNVTLFLYGLSILGLIAYGLVVGSFSGGEQWWAAPTKIAGGLVVSSLICLPSLYVFSCLAGSRASIRQIIGLVAGLLAVMTLLLIGFAPVAWVFSQSTESVTTMGLLHLLFWGIAMYFATAFFHTGFKELVAAKGEGVRKVWLTVFVVVVLQMSTALRPIIGTSDTYLPSDKRFFLGHWLQSIEAGARSSGAAKAESRYDF